MADSILVACPQGHTKMVTTDYIGRKTTCSCGAVWEVTGAVPTIILQPTWSPGVAAVLSFLVPGLGQMYKGQVLNGFAWFAIVVIGYIALIVPGVLLHFCCVIGAASGKR